MKSLSDTCHSLLRVPSFKASKYLITNREYLEFVNDGGYETSKYWTKEGEQMSNVFCCVMPSRYRFRRQFSGFIAHVSGMLHAVHTNLDIGVLYLVVVLYQL